MAAAVARRYADRFFAEVARLPRGTADDAIAAYRSAFKAALDRVWCSPVPIKITKYSTKLLQVSGSPSWSSARHTPGPIWSNPSISATFCYSPVPAAKLLLATPPAGSLGSFSAYATLSLGSALVLFLYPHSITGILSSSSARVVRRNAAA